ncbi:MAG: EexN family lipoprotein [Pseudomonadota bacterium]
MRQKITPIQCSLALLAMALSACAPEPEPRSVDDFLKDPIGLDATLERCNQRRGVSKDDVECQNARSANKRLGAIELENRRAEAEAESQRKLEVIRRRNQAQAEAARRAQEEAAMREQEAYEAQFNDAELDSEPAPSNYESYEPHSSEPPDSPADYETPPPAPVTPNPEPEPVNEELPETSAPGDMDALREELKRRSEQAPSAPANSDSQ